MARLKSIVANSKGGVGKSTVAMQVLAPYIFNKTNTKVKYFELDDENNDAKAFSTTALIELQKQKVKCDLRDVTQSLILENDQLIVDIGANQTTTDVLGALIENGMIYDIDLALIPLMDGEQDAINAINAYIAIRDATKKAKIVFVLNRHNTTRNLNSQFDIFLGDTRGFFEEMGLINDVKPEDRNVISLADSDVIKYARKFGLSAYELAKLDRDLDHELKTAIEQQKDLKTIKYLSFKKMLQTDAVKYLSETLNPVFEKLDLILRS